MGNVGVFSLFLWAVAEIATEAAAEEPKAAVEAACAEKLLCLYALVRFFLALPVRLSFACVRVATIS